MFLGRRTDSLAMSQNVALAAWSLLESMHVPEETCPPKIQCGTEVNPIQKPKLDCGNREDGKKQIHLKLLAVKTNKLKKGSKRRVSSSADKHKLKVCHAQCLQRMLKVKGCKKNTMCLLPWLKMNDLAMQHLIAWSSKQQNGFKKTHL